MTKKHFIALADAIKAHNELLETTRNPGYVAMMFNEAQIETIAHFCQSQNAQFNREQWLSYIAGTCGPNGGEK